MAMLPICLRKFTACHGRCAKNRPFGWAVTSMTSAEPAGSCHTKDSLFLSCNAREQLPGL